MGTRLPLAGLLLRVLFFVTEDESQVEEVLTRGQRGYKFTNWSTTFSCSPELFFEPETTDDIREILQAASGLRKTVRVVGGAHSPSDIACTDGYMISLKNFKAVLEFGGIGNMYNVRTFVSAWSVTRQFLKQDTSVIDQEKQQVTVQAGLTIQELNELLNDHGLALSNLSSVSEMSCAGTISTCTHGTGKDFGLLATMVVSLELMTANGEIMHCSRRQNKEIFLAALCSLGAVGIILSVTWQCEKAFRLLQLSEPKPLEEELENLESSMSSSEHYRFLWYPHTGYVKSFNVSRTTKPKEDNPSWFWDHAVGYYSLEFMLWLSSFIPNLVQWINWGHFKLFHSKPQSRINQSYKIFNFDCLFKQYVSEWAFPWNETAYVLRKLQSWTNESGFSAHFPVEVRFVKKDDIYMSPCYEQDMCFINIISYRPYHKFIPHENYWTYFEDLMMSVGGKPHWAKAHKLTYTEIEKMYPKIEKFREICNQLDPQGLFRNEYLERVIFSPPQLSEKVQNGKLASSKKLCDRLSSPHAVSPGF